MKEQETKELPKVFYTVEEFHDMAFKEFVI